MSRMSTSRLNQLADSFIKARPLTGRSCLVLGATGESGKRITRNLIVSGAFALIKVISRTPVPSEFLPEAPAGVKLEQVLISNFDSIDETSQIFENCDFVFCALGTTKAKAGSSEQFIKIDHDMPLRLLEIAKSSGCKYLALISSASASSSSPFLYPKTKGKLEDDLLALDFEALRIYRPALIRVNRNESRFIEKMAISISPVLDFFSLGRASIDIEVLADSIVKDALIYGINSNNNSNNQDHVIIYENKSIKSER